MNRQVHDAIFTIGHSTRKVIPATLTPGARLMGDGTLRYPATEDVAPPGSDGL